MAVLTLKEDWLENIMEYFPDVPVEALQFELTRNGLGEGKVDEQLRQVAENEFERLRQLWQGPDIPVYLFPIIDGTIKKNGKMYEGIILLFVSNELSQEEVKALLAHEYNHSCRMQFIGKNMQEMTLLDSIVLEGLAEYAVEELYGTRYLSPWTRLYKTYELLPTWKERIQKHLQVTDVHQHAVFLYGDASHHIPSWFGYCAGYTIVKQYTEKNTVQSIRQLLQLQSTTLLTNTDFQ